MQVCSVPHQCCAAALLQHDVVELYMDDCYHTIKQLGQALRSYTITPTALTEQYLARIRRYDPHLGAFQCLTEERARAEAQAAEEELDSGIDRGPLHGIPYAVKDLFDVADTPTTAGTDLLNFNIALDDASVVKRLKAAGAILIGKTKTVQLAYGGAGINTQQGTPHNPWQREPHLPGGSSSGSAVAVAAGMAAFALGTDTGGSVRIPAAHCGISALKTTVGQVSRSGVYPLSWSMDSVGPLTRTIEDAALVYSIITGGDANDESTASHRSGDVLPALQRGIASLRLGIPETLFFDAADAEVAALVHACSGVFRGLDADVDNTAFSVAADAMGLNSGGLVIAAEAYTLNQTLVDQHFDKLDPVVAERIVKGRGVLAHEYLKTVREWEKLRRRALAEFSSFDALLCPTVMMPPVPLADIGDDLKKYQQCNLQCLRNTSVGNILNLSAVSLPCGFTSTGLPVGLMLYAKPCDEATLLRIAHAFQSHTDWHLQTPPLDWL